MLKEFYNQRGLSRSNFRKWAKKLLVDFVPGIDYEIINGDYSFEPTAKLVVVLRLKERYSKHVTYDEIYDAFIAAGIKTNPYYIIEKEHFWPKIVHEVHTIWRSRRSDKFAKLEDPEVEVPEEFQDVVLEGNDIVLSAPKTLLPEADLIVEESTPAIQPKQEQDDDNFDIEIS